MQRSIRCLPGYVRCTRGYVRCTQGPHDILLRIVLEWVLNWWGSSVASEAAEPSSDSFDCGERGGGAAERFERPRVSGGAAPSGVQGQNKAKSKAKQGI